MMSGSASGDQIAWVARVLGVTPEPETGGSGTLSLVKLGRARIEFLGAQRRAVSEIGRLRGTLQKKFGDDTEQAGVLARADAALNTLAQSLGEGLNDQLDAVLNESDAGKRQRLATTARATMQRLAKLVDGNPIMAKLDGNEVLPDMQVRAPLAAGLRAIAAVLG
jgi:hypothetical protein